MSGTSSDIVGRSDTSGGTGDRLLSMQLSTEVAGLFRALADPSRTRIVYALVHEDMTTSGLAALLGLNAPAVSQHLRTLRALRIVKPRREGQLVFYSLDDEHIRLLITLTLTHLSEAQGTSRGVPAEPGSVHQPGA